MKTLTISDNTLLRAAVDDALRHAVPDAAHAQCPDFALALTLLAGNHYDLVAFDLDMPRSGRVAGAQLLLELWPGLAVAVVTAAPRKSEIERALHAGALGYVAMRPGDAHMRDAFAQVLGRRRPAIAACTARTGT